MIPLATPVLVPSIYIDLFRQPEGVGLHTYTYVGRCC